MTSTTVGIDLAGIPGWSLIRGESGEEFWWKGYLLGRDPADLAGAMAELHGEEALVAALKALVGNFAFVWRGQGRVVAAVDAIASIPLYHRRNAAGSCDITGLAGRLQQPGDTPDASASLVMAMAGFTLGATTLIQDITPLLSGQCLVAEDGQAPQVLRYRRYLPRPAHNAATESTVALRDLTMQIMEDTAASAAGRTIVVPISAGLDSRLIVSALKEIDYRNVICISYGRHGNHESLAGRRIAAALGYPWHEIPHSPAQQAATFASDDCRRFVDELADSQQGIPFQQDFFAVGEVQKRQLAPDDAIFINGQSGDFIAGNHIPKALVADPGQPLFDAFVGKHFGMWQCLKTPANMAVLKQLFDVECSDCLDAADWPMADFAVYEALECENRQAKYVVAGQRTYEWYGYDWRLPLWDQRYMDFWETASLADKLGENLYRRMLIEANWGGVWGDDWVFPQNVVPGWMRPLRFLAKAAHAVRGREAWHRFERRYIAWVTDPVANYAIAPYRTVAGDRRGHRNAIAWHVDHYLRGKGITIRADGTLNGA